MRFISPGYIIVSLFYALIFISMPTPAQAQSAVTLTSGSSMDRASMARMNALVTQMGQRLSAAETCSRKGLIYDPDAPIRDADDCTVGTNPCGDVGTIYGPGHPTHDPDGCLPDFQVLADGVAKFKQLIEADQGVLVGEPLDSSGDPLNCDTSIEGTIRYNKTEQQAEMCIGTEWTTAAFGGGAAGAGGVGCVWNKGSACPAEFITQADGKFVNCVWSNGRDERAEYSFYSLFGEGCKAGYNKTVGPATVCCAGDGGAPTGPAPVMLVDGRWTGSDCTGLGGEVVDVPEGKICRFTAASCPSGWQQHNNWTETTENCDGPTSGVTYTTERNNCTDAPVTRTHGPHSCCSGEHGWGNQAVEACSDGGSRNGWQTVNNFDGTCCRCDNFIITDVANAQATVTLVGCK